MSGRCILILGGVRSGKSRFAQELAGQLSDKVLFVATAEALDKDMAHRIEAHKKSRAETWQTLEIPTNIGNELKRVGIGDAEVVIIDCLTLLLSNLVSEGSHDAEEIDYSSFESQAQSEIEDLLNCADSLGATFIIVSNEVGSGLVPPHKSGRVYRDALGKANQLIAGRADEVYVMFAGIPVEIKSLESRRRDMEGENSC